MKNINETPSKGRFNVKLTSYASTEKFNGTSGVPPTPKEFFYVGNEGRRIEQKQLRKELEHISGILGDLKHVFDLHVEEKIWKIEEISWFPRIFDACLHAVLTDLKGIRPR